MNTFTQVKDIFSKKCSASDLRQRADAPHQVMTKKETAKASEAIASRKERRPVGSWEIMRGTTSHDVL